MTKQGLRPAASLTCLLAVAALSLGTAGGDAHTGVVPAGYPAAWIHMADEMGSIAWRFRPDAAPLTVENFANLSRSGFFVNSSFYRYEPGFVLQGGGDRGFNGRGMSNATVPLEAVLPNVNMSVGLARTSDPNSGSSEFFINLADNLHLDHANHSDGYCVFAEVVGGYSTIRQIEKNPTHLVDNNTFRLFDQPPPRIADIHIINVSASCTEEVVDLQIPTDALPWARLVTDHGPIDLQLRPDAAPATVRNFMRLIDTGFYHDSFVYRYEPGFVFQGGRDEFAGHQDRSKHVPLEYCLQNRNLTVGVSRFDNPNSGSSEYFFNIGNNTDALSPGGWTPYGYTVFAHVIGGLSTLDRLATLPTHSVNGSRFHLFDKPYPIVKRIVLCSEPIGSVDCTKVESSSSHRSRTIALAVFGTLVGMAVVVMFAAFLYRRMSTPSRRTGAMEAEVLHDIVNC